MQHGKELDSVVKTIAFRRIQIVEKPLVDQSGLSWYFEINNISVFMGGPQGQCYFTTSEGLLPQF